MVPKRVRAASRAVASKQKTPAKKAIRARRDDRHERPKHRRFTLAEILRWADACHERTGDWPNYYSGQIPECSDQTWSQINYALRVGRRGLPGGSTLADLLSARRGVRNIRNLPRLTERQVLAWADRHHARTGKWPNILSGPIAQTDGETWRNVAWCLRLGLRGLPAGTTIARFLVERRGARIHTYPPPLTIAEILRWSDAHFARTGKWPTSKSGPVVGVPGENWEAVARALANGRRGLSDGSSLGDLLEKKRGMRNVRNLPALRVAQILKWADAYHTRRGRWPSSKSGPIPEAPGETWWTVQLALYRGRRGLPSGSSLAQLLAAHRGVRMTDTRNRPPLSADLILKWADAHHARTGKWPNTRTGPITDAPGERWDAVQNALDFGYRGFPGGSSLTRLLVERRGIRNEKHPPRLTIRQILEWAEAHRARTGAWPLNNSGPIALAPGESWRAVAVSLRTGLRGLPGGMSLAGLLARKRRVKTGRSPS